MKKIIIFYASYGGGHLTAAKSIYEYLTNNYKNLDVELIDCMKYVNITIEKITTAAYREMAKKAPWAWGKIYADSQTGPLAHISSRSNEIMAIKLLRLLREKKPDLIISTHPFGSQMCCYLKRKGKINSEIATIMTDFAPHDQWLIGSDYTDYFFIANDKIRNYLISKKIDENKIFVTGIPISNKFSQNFDKREIYKNFGLKENLFTILFFGGGAFGLGKSKTIEVFECFVKNFDNIQMIAISGKNEKMKNEFEEIVNKNNKQDNIKILEYTDKVPELMHISDLVVTKPGGLTTSESLASNLPMLIINPIPGQEEDNANYLEEKGVAIWIRKNDNPQTIINNLLNDKNKLLKMKKSATSLSKKDSTKKICQILLKKNI